MSTRRVIRWAQVEYQPNLQFPAEPVPLGVVVEELRGSGRQLIIVGREPRCAVPGLQLDEAWGPFRDVVTAWVEVFSKSVREFIEETQPQHYALDELARRWKSNVYLKQPESTVVHTSITLDTYARRWYEEYVGDPFPHLPSQRQMSPSRAVRNRQRPWLSRTNLLQAIA